MKKLMTILLLLSSFSSYSRTCKDLYQNDTWRKVVIDENIGMNMVYSGGFGFLTSAFITGMKFNNGTIASKAVLPALFKGTVAAPVAILGLVGVSASVTAIHNLKPQKMIRLIEEAQFYSVNEEVPGKQLKKLWKKVNKEYTLKELADYITRANEDLSFCTIDRISFNQLTNHIKDGTVNVIEN